MQDSDCVEESEALRLVQTDQMTAPQPETEYKAGQNVIFNQSQQDGGMSTQDVDTPLSINRRYKSLASLLLISLNLCLSSFYFGYTIAYLSSIKFQVIINVFGITISQDSAKGILVGAVPIGGGLGALASSQLLKHLSRRKCILAINCLALAAGCLSFVTNFYVLILCRVLQGACVGLNSAIVPLVLSQFAPNQISGVIGAMNQLFVGGGVTFAFLFEYILSKIADSPTGSQIWRIVFGLTLITTAIQSLMLIFVFPYETPRYLLQKGEIEETRKLLRIIYLEEFVDEVLTEKQADLASGQTSDSLQSEERDDTPIQNEKKDQSPKVAVFMAVHLAVLQQFSGINAVVGYGGDIASETFPELVQIIPIILNLEQTIMSLVTGYLLTRFGRKIILQVGTVVAAVSLTLIGIGFAVKQSASDFSKVAIIFGLFVFMANFGASLGPVVWLYIPEIVRPSYVPFSTMANWTTASLVMLLFPIIKAALPNENPALLFFFFAIWCTVSFVVGAKFLVETKGKTQRQIRSTFTSKTNE